MIVVDPGFAERLRTRHTRRFAVTLGDADAGSDVFTRELPNVDADGVAHLDETGLATVGSAVRPGTVLVGKTTEIAGGPLSAEEKLLRAIFGEAAGEVRDSSLRAPPRCFGEVLEAAIDGARATVVVGWERPLEVGDVLRVDGVSLVVAEIRPLDADVGLADSAKVEVEVIKESMGRDALMGRSIGPYDSPGEQPIRDVDGLAGQVITAGAAARLASAAPWLAFELATIKADCVDGRTRVFEAVVRGERPDLTPRSVALAPGVTRSLPAGGVFHFFDREQPPPEPGEEAALPLEGIGSLVLHLRALGLEVDPQRRAPGVTLMTAARVVETSRGEVRGPADLASQQIFGPTADYACACGKHRRMRDRGVVCEVCKVEVIQSRVRRERCGHIELAAPCVHPLFGAARRRKGRARDEADGEAPALTTLVVLPPGLRGPAIDAAYGRVLSAAADDLQAAVDALFAAIIKVVDGELHPRIFEKAVDFSGAAQLVIDPTLAPGECRVPRSMVHELWRPHAYGLLEAQGYTTTIKSSRRMVERERPEALAALAEASEGAWVLLLAGEAFVGRRVRAWDLPAIGVDAATADALGCGVVTLHLPLSYEAGLAVVGLADESRPRASRSDGWLARARRDGRLVASAIAAARSGEVDELEDPAVRFALGRAPEPVDDEAIAGWQAAEAERRRDNHERLAAQRPAEDPIAAAIQANLERPVDELELSVRTANGLANLGISTLRELCARSEADLLGSGQIGPKSLAELKEIIAELGLTLGMPGV